MPRIITMETKSGASVLGRPGTSYSWPHGFEGNCHVPKRKSVSGEFLLSLLLQVNVSEHLEIKSSHNFSACGEIRERTQAK